MPRALRGPAAGVALQARGLGAMVKLPHSRRAAPTKPRARFSTTVSSRSLLRNLYVIGPARGLRDRRPVLADAFEMKLNRLANFRLDLFQRVANRDASGQIRNVRRNSSALPSRSRQHNAWRRSLSPACRRMLFNAPGCKSALSLPGTASRPTGFMLLRPDDAWSSLSRPEGFWR